MADPHHPKPLVDLGNHALILHVIGHFYSYGFRDFICCAGHRSFELKDYFASLRLRYATEATISLDGARPYYAAGASRIPLDWHVTIVDTGPDIGTAGRISGIRHLIDSSPFIITYCDGLSDIDLHALLAAHRAERRLATISAVNASSAFGIVDGEAGLVTRFVEKPITDGALINAGFIAADQDLFKAIDAVSESASLEGDVLSSLAANGQLALFRHDGFWRPVDTPKDCEYVASLLKAGPRPWRFFEF